MAVAAALAPAKMHAASVTSKGPRALPWDEESEGAGRAADMRSWVTPTQQGRPRLYTILPEQRKNAVNELERNFPPCARMAEWSTPVDRARGRGRVFLSFYVGVARRHPRAAH